MDLSLSSSPTNVKEQAPELCPRRAVPDLLDRRQNHAIQGVFNCNQHHGVLASQDLPKIEHSFGLHFDQRAGLEFGTFRLGRNTDSQALPLAAFEVGGMSFSIRQFPERHPFTLFGHVPDYTPCPRLLARLIGAWHLPRISSLKSCSRSR
jgi:hypothetical protein